MLTPRVVERLAVSCHPSGASIDRELRCEQCGTRMFSSRAPELLEAGLRCSSCGGALCLLPAPGA